MGGGDGVFEDYDPVSVKEGGSFCDYVKGWFADEADVF